MKRDDDVRSDDGVDFLEPSTGRWCAVLKKNEWKRKRKREGEQEQEQEKERESGVILHEVSTYFKQV